MLTINKVPLKDFISSLLHPSINPFIHSQIIGYTMPLSDIVLATQYVEEERQREPHGQEATVREVISFNLRWK